MEDHRDDGRSSLDRAATRIQTGSNPADVEQRLRDIEDALMTWGALAAVGTDAVEGMPATKIEVMACQEVFGRAMERIRDRVLART